MQAHNHEENWTNEMENMPASEVPLDPNWGFGGAEAGVRNLTTDLLDVVYPGTYQLADHPYEYDQGAVQDFDASSTVGYSGAAQITDGSYEYSQGTIQNFGTSRALGRYSAAAQPAYAHHPFPPIVGDDVFDNFRPSMMPEAAAGFDSHLMYPMTNVVGAGTAQQYHSHLAPNSQLQPGGVTLAANHSQQMGNTTVVANPPQPMIPCTQLNCFSSFKRDADRIRHETSVHGVNFTRHFCHVAGCPKSQGAGYTRRDKLTEHLWKKHANLGFAKRV